MELGPQDDALWGSLKEQSKMRALDWQVQGAGHHCGEPLLPENTGSTAAACHCGLPVDFLQMFKAVVRPHPQRSHILILIPSPISIPSLHSSLLLFLPFHSHLSSHQRTAEATLKGTARKLPRVSHCTVTVARRYCSDSATGQFLLGIYSRYHC